MLAGTSAFVETRHLPENPVWPQKAPGEPPSLSPHQGSATARERGEGQSLLCSSGASDPAPGSAEAPAATGPLEGFLPSTTGPQIPRLLNVHFYASVQVCVRACVCPMLCFKNICLDELSAVSKIYVVKPLGVRLRPPPPFPGSCCAEEAFGRGVPAVYQDACSLPRGGSSSITRGFFPESALKSRFSEADASLGGQFLGNAKKTLMVFSSFGTAHVTLGGTLRPYERTPRSPPA